MNLPLTLALLLVWCFLAWRSFQRGDMAGALALLAIGIALTAWRLSRVKKATQ
jgi:uncharacterized membrane protein YqjE